MKIESQLFKEKNRWTIAIAKLEQSDLKWICKSYRKINIHTYTHSQKTFHFLKISLVLKIKRKNAA